MIKKFLKPEIVIRAAFLVFGSTYIFFGLATGLNGSYASPAAWREMTRHPSPFLFVGLVFFYFGLRKKSILATLKGEPKNGK